MTATCRNGLHPLTPDNLYRYPDGRATCLACRRAVETERSARRREQRDTVPSLISSRVPSDPNYDLAAECTRYRLAIEQALVLLGQGRDRAARAVLWAVQAPTR
jgi:hypothetical protein